MGAVENLFPATTEADWRRAAEAALKGVSLETLVSKTADGVRIEPVYPPAEGPRATRPGGPWRIIARLDHPNAGEANAQALDDLANGADGLQVVSSGALGAYGFGLRQFDSATLHKALDGVRFDAAVNFELDLGPDGPDQALSFAALIERLGAKPEDGTVSFGLDPFAASARGPFPADWSAQARRCVETALALRSKGFTGPFLVADARGVHAAGGTPAQELAFALAAAVTLLRLLDEAGAPLAEARVLIAFRLAADADELATLSKFRALRIAWSHVKEACGLEPRAARVQAESAWRTMTARDPYVNVMRGAVAATSSRAPVIAFDISPRMCSRPSRACSSATRMISGVTEVILMSICSAVMPVSVPATLKSMSPRWSSSPRMSDSTAKPRSSLISPIAMPATGRFNGTPASISASELPHTVAIEDDPLLSVISETTRSV